MVSQTKCIFCVWHNSNWFVKFNYSYIISTIIRAISTVTHFHGDPSLTLIRIFFSTRLIMQKFKFIIKRANTSINSCTCNQYASSVYRKQIASGEPFPVFQVLELIVRVNLFGVIIETLLAMLARPAFGPSFKFDSLEISHAISRQVLFTRSLL